MPPTPELGDDTMPHPEPVVTWTSTLDWPADDDLEEAVVQCAGSAFLGYEAHLLGRRPFLHGSQYYRAEADEATDTAPSTAAAGDEGGKKKKKEYDLLTLPERKLEKLSHYQILGRSLPMHASTDEIRKAYHKACLRYHPDKTGRGEEDEVFLLVKKAFDTLSDPMKRRSYDSVQGFDESIPKEGVDEANFYKEYGPAFDRNLRFARCNDPARSAGDKAEADGAPKKKGKNKNKKGRGQATPGTPPPSLGDDATPMPQVHAFYEFWVNFDSWRDFTAKAAEEAEHDVESADCREEKRWMQNEIRTRVKKMKRDEMARVNLLVERAMGLDPRLKRERVRLATEKREKEEAKKKAELEKAEKERIEQESLAKVMAQKRVQEESKKKDAKKIREQQKKQLRKAKQLFRKLTMAAYQAGNPNDGSIGNDAVWDDLETMNDDIELLCDKLSVMELTSLSDLLGGPEAAEEGSHVAVRVGTLADVKQCAVETAAGAERQSLVAIQQRERAREEDAARAREAKLSRAPGPWSKEERAALAKGVKKYPPGGSNRWDAIAQYVNNLCKLPELRTKEEAIEKYNQLASSFSEMPGKVAAEGGSGTSGGDSNENTDKSNEGVWTEDQDALFQKMLRKYPASMDKNERWKSIAKGVPGRNKKECVQRFKAIREAVKHGKK